MGRKSDAPDSDLPGSPSSRDASDIPTSPGAPFPSFAPLADTLSAIPPGVDKQPEPRPEAQRWEGPSGGTLIDGKFRVVGPLGQGGMGVVVPGITSAPR